MNGSCLVGVVAWLSPSAESDNSARRIVGPGVDIPRQRRRHGRCILDDAEAPIPSPEQIDRPRNWRDGGDGESPSRTGDAKDAGKVVGRAGQNGRKAEALSPKVSRNRPRPRSNNLVASVEPIPTRGLLSHCAPHS
jgi:hypothetical protein